MPETQNQKLVVNEIFKSLQGEGLLTGVITTFIRLTGCPIRCNYCDTSYAFSEGYELTISEIIDKISELQSKTITITGGEPLYQEGVCSLITSLCDLHYVVAIETSGCFDISLIDKRASVVMDIKTPSSGASDKTYWDNLSRANDSDQIKFVISDKSDYEWSKKIISEKSINCQVLFSTNTDHLLEKDLAEWIVADNLNVRFQIQLHKYLWPDQRGK